MSNAKPFQEATAQAAFLALRKKAGSHRFLVADEVGLGKTMVAREVIRKFLELPRRSGIRVLYVCSNLTIARQNGSRLLPNPTQDKILEADRLTTVWQELDAPPKGTVQLITITPETSIPLRRSRPSMGKGEERALLLRLIHKRWKRSRRHMSAKDFRGMVGKKRWRELSKDASKKVFPRELSSAFAQNLPNRSPEGVLSSESQSNYQTVSRLRSALAAAVLESIRPDLVIFDEFQRFRDLLLAKDTKVSKWDRVTPMLRGEGWSKPPGILLLSATPYRLYTTSTEDADGTKHHDQLFEILEYLLGKDANHPGFGTKAIKKSFGNFKAALDASPREEAAIIAARDALQQLLRPLMARTERQIGTFDSVTTAHGCVEPDPSPADLHVFSCLVGGLRPEDRRWSIDLWKSIPLPQQTLGPGYIVWKRAQHLMPDRPIAFLKRHRNSFTSPKSWPHPWLRALRENSPGAKSPDFSIERLSLPWVSPSIPWWPLKGPWAAAKNSSHGKALIFSRFRALPLALAGLLSYDLECHWLRGRLKYDRLLKKAAPLKISRTSRSVLALFLPSPTLIEFTDPLRAKQSGKRSIEAEMREQVRQCLKKLGFKISTKSSCRPYSALLAQLESHDAGTWDKWITTATYEWPKRDGSETMLRDLLEEWPIDDRDQFSSAEVNLLARHALGNPGIVVGRAFQRAFGPLSTADDEKLSALLGLCWYGFQRYLNRRLFARILKRRGLSYPEAIVQGVIDGNLEAVLDEHWNGPGGPNKSSPKSVADAVQELRESLGLVSGRAVIHEGNKTKPFNLRCHTAMPFLEAKLPDEGGKALRTESLREAFNSPFWPHILITTSVGQEGLDFHRWCREILHWDLCHSPVELEQREGRIQRFGSLSVRRAVAARLGEASWKRLEPAKGLWPGLMALAEEEFSDESGLSPWWVFEGAKIQPWFFSLSHSRLSERVHSLQRDRGLYRLAMGQPNQEEFIQSLKIQPEEAKRYLLCLSPALGK